MRLRNVLQWQQSCEAAAGGAPRVPAVHQHLLHQHAAPCVDAKRLRMHMQAAQWRVGQAADLRSVM